MSRAEFSFLLANSCCHNTKHPHVCISKSEVKGDAAPCDAMLNSETWGSLLKLVYLLLKTHAENSLSPGDPAQKK
jgi:hypothetical protein